MCNLPGACKIVPKLKAPGFITAVTSDGTWADVSSCSGLTIVAKAATAYKGYRISFGHAHPMFGKIFAYGYKACPQLRSASQCCLFSFLRAYAGPFQPDGGQLRLGFHPVRELYRFLG